MNKYSSLIRKQKVQFEAGKLQKNQNGNGAPQKVCFAFILFRFFFLPAERTSVPFMFYYKQFQTSGSLNSTPMYAVAWRITRSVTY